MKDEEQKNRRILVIDDNESIHKDFREILEVGGSKTAALDEARSAVLGDTATKASELEGFEIDSVFQGQEGLEKVKQALVEDRPYAMAFVDVRMPPGWNGIETIGHLWAEYPELQVVICTAYSDYQWSDIIDKLGQTDQLLILKKPFDNVEVRQLACSLTEKWTLARQTQLRQKDLEVAVAERTAELVKTNEQLEQEIEERRRAEDAVRVSEEKYRTQFEESMDAIFVADADTGMIIDCNAAAARLVGREKNEIIGQHQRILHPPEQIEGGFSGTFKQHRMQEKGDTLETQVITKEGEIKDVAIKANVFELGGKRVVQGTFRDVTERKRAEEKLKEHDRLKTEFVVNVSHELRTPLTIFKNIVSNLMSGVAGKINDKQRESLEIANKEVSRLSRIINDFLDISRIEAGIQLNQENVRIQSLVSDVVELFRPLADEKKMKLRTSMSEAGLFVNIDRDRMIQVLANLIDNAIKFVPDRGGQITVRVEELALDDEVSIVVEDNGPGIKMDDISKVFDRFVQVEKHVGPGSHGTGLGLTISKELVELHGGRIWAENVPTGGTHFCFVLPKSSSDFENRHKTGND